VPGLRLLFGVTQGYSFVGFANACASVITEEYSGRYKKDGSKHE
jgi:hypothetical protein